MPQSVRDSKGHLHASEHFSRLQTTVTLAACLFEAFFRSHTLIVCMLCFALQDMAIAPSPASNDLHYPSGICIGGRLQHSHDFPATQQ